MDVSRARSDGGVERAQWLDRPRGGDAPGRPVSAAGCETPESLPGGQIPSPRVRYAVSVGLLAALAIPVGVDGAGWAGPVFALGLLSTAALPRLKRRDAPLPRGIGAEGDGRWGRGLDRLPLALVSQEADLLARSGRGWWGVPYEPIKRSIDVGFAMALAVCALPLLLVVALAVVLDSPGGVLYSQTRVGLHGRRFRIYKLRTMRQDAERHGAVYAEDNDPRVTRIGRFLRLTRIDELPQLWNVLRGEMSVVGPRPERPEFTETLERAVPHYAKRYATKPGLTGWAQVRYRYTSTVEDTARKLEYDLYYLKHASVWLDLRILAATVRVVLGLQGR